MPKLSERNRKWWILAAMTSTISMIFIDITVLPVALPTIQRELDISELGLQWIINAYTLALTVFVLVGGRLGDMFGHLKMFFFGLVIFAFFSALCGLSYFSLWFITSRFFQGIGGAILIPATVSMIISSFPQQQRGKAMGIYVSVGSIFLSIGPFIGGLLSQYLSWRFVFWINLPIAAIGFLLAKFSVPKQEKVEKKPLRFDYFGFIAFGLGLTAVVIAFMQAKYWDWFSLPTLLLIALGITLMLLMIVIDRRVEEPFLDFSIFKTPNFIGGLATLF
ncbi:MAG: MFS transporter, partial [Chlamydiae bacterium]|nr:MFS transporter [Chlamydiota bacterium]